MRKQEQLWCPNGDGAFDAWVVRCPRCGERLVDRPPANATDDQPVRVALAPNQAIAELWKSALESEGIVTMLRPLGPGFGAWGSVATFEHEILVRERDAEQARDVLAEWME
jgi:hypothetical protein